MRTADSCASGAMLALSFVVASIAQSAAHAADAPESADAKRSVAPQGTWRTTATAQIADIRVRYREAGSGPPLVLLHGGYGSSDTWPPEVIARFAREFRVIAPDSRGRSGTTLGAGPITPRRMAEDTVRLLDHLGIGQAHLLGHSEGGSTVVAMLIDHRDRVLRAVVSGTVGDLAQTRSLEAMRKEAAALVDGSSDGARMLEAGSASHSPEPQRFPEIKRQLAQSWLTYPSFHARELATIDRPLLVIGSNRDEYLPRDAFARFAAEVPGARLHDAGDVGHAVWRARRDALAEVASTFLRAGVPAADAARGASAGRKLRVDDIDVHYLDFGAGPPVLMLHGGFGSTRLWEPAGQQLARCHRVIIPDLRGRGLTPDGDGPLSPSRMARDAIGLLDRLGISRAHVVGHSAGSIVTLALLQDYPERVSSVALVGSPAMIADRSAGPIGALQADLRRMQAGTEPQDASMRAFRDEWRGRALEPARFERMVGKLADGMSIRIDPAPLAGRAPTLVVRAGRDELIPPEAFTALAQTLRADRIVDYPQGTHQLPRREAASLARELAAFYAGSADSPCARSPEPASAPR